MSALSKNEIRELRPSLVVAEALVNRHGPKQIEDRARRLGYSHGLTNAVVAACCRCSADTKPTIRTPVTEIAPSESFHS